MAELKIRLCEICKKEFVPNSPHQKYCKDLHYRICPVCGKSYPEPNLDKFKHNPTTCSMECRVTKRTKTSLEKYGITAPGNNPNAREKAKQTMNARYGVNYAQESEEIKKKSETTWINKYGVNNPQKCQQIQEKTKNTNIRKYGSTSYLNSKEGKQNIDEIMMAKYGTTIPLRVPEIKQKQIDTNINKYGVPYPSALDEIKEKAKQTSLIKYGTEYPQSSEIVKQHIKDTFMRNYGVDNCFKSKEIIEKIKTSFYNRYGVHSVMEVEEIAARIRETSIKRYGVPYYVMLPQVSRSSGRVSKKNKVILNKLEQMGINGSLEFSIEQYSYDIYIPQGNTLIEIDPTYTHSTVGNHWNPKGIDKNYHLRKTILAHSHGYRCLHIWNWDSVSKFINALSVKNTLYIDASPEKINHSESAEFINKYSLYNITENIPNILFIGLRHKTKLIMLMGFRQIDPIFNVWELLCIENRFNYIVYNGNKKILDAFINQYNPSKIVSYADFSKTNGEILENLGFEYKQFILPTKVWSKGLHAIADDPSILPESMMSDHWLPIYNCGYKVYEKIIHPITEFI